MGLNLRKQFGTDTSRENDGVWVELGDGARILVARYGNAKQKKLGRRLARPHRHQLRDIDTSEAAARTVEDLEKQTVAHCVLLDWEGILMPDDKGVEKPLDYSPDVALKLFKDIDDFFLTVVEIARDRANFAAIDQEDTVGNLPAALSGSSDGAPTKGG